MNSSETSPPRRHTRRQFLRATAGIAAGALTTRTFAESALPPAEEAVSFFLIGDTHYLADIKAPKEIDAASRKVTSGLIRWLNQLPETEIPQAAGGGTVPKPNGVIHAGDLIDTGDKNGKLQTEMQETELKAFLEDWGLNGGDGKLKHPVFEIHGNHDSPRGDGPVISEIIARNRRRSGLKNVSPNGLHYAWEWGGVRFLNLGIVVGGEWDAGAKRGRYAPKDSLEFLKDDLAKNGGTSGRPVILTHHVDIARYCKPGPADGPLQGSPEWDPTDALAYHEALRGCNVCGILFGHTHVRKLGRWDGTPKEPKTGGLRFFNTDNASHFKDKKQAFLHFTLRKNEMTVREFATADAWETGQWTPAVWRFPMAVS